MGEDITDKLFLENNYGATSHDILIKWKKKKTCWDFYFFLQCKLWEMCGHELAKPSSLDSSES